MSAIVVSGGGTGIGRAVVERLVADGREVTAVGRRREPLEALGVDFVTADVSTEAGAAAVAEHVGECAGVVAAAGGLAGTWQAAFESNVLTAVHLVEALRPELERAAGRVVLLSSVAALRGSNGGPYGAMKAALHAWMYDLARDLGPHGGTANVVAPGFVPDTEFWEGRLSEENRAERASQTLVGREGTPREIASLIAWLLGPDGGWVTGQVLSPNGGVVLGR
jgi:NAD(P)-dependent dehydrogenase (short-subunit alcohol dehydrogenase family)